MSEVSSLPQILVVDDEPMICRNCVKILNQGEHEYIVEAVTNGYEAIDKVDRNDVDVVLTDLKMGSLGGMEVLRRIQTAHPETVVVVMTGFSSVSSAVEVMRVGAFDYIPKPFTPEELRTTVHAAVEEARRRKQAQPPPAETADAPVDLEDHRFIGISPKIQKVIHMVRKVAPTESTVLIQGESGTGKELIARAIHVNSTRKDHVFFAVDCGTLADERLESEMFGHVKGAFTGAYRDKAGIFQLADSGTVFLDEISNISYDIQAKLLRFLENRTFIPVGGTQTETVDLRLILATNRDLGEMVQNGTFREDFYYRIYVYPIFVPPLRERKEDIMPIAEHFLNLFSNKLGKRIEGFAKSAAALLAEYEWPGNVRQIRNVVERAVILCEKSRITPADLPLFGHSDISDNELPMTNESLKRMKKKARQAAADRVERDFIVTVLMQNDWNISKTALRVGIQRTNLQNMIKKHGIRKPRNLVKNSPPEEKINN